MLVIVATVLFATMGMAVKFASANYGTGEIVFYRGIVGVAIMVLLMQRRGVTLRTGLPAMHFRRSLTGVCALGLWFYAVAELPLSTAVTLLYTSPVWMAALLIGSSILHGSGRVDIRLACAVLVGFGGAVCILQPTMKQDQLWAGLMGLLSGLLTGMAYLQVTALGKAGEPETRVVFYFSVLSIGAGVLITPFAGGWHGHTLQGLGMLLAVGLLATLAQLSITLAFARGRILVNGSLQYLSVVWAYVYGMLLFDDAVTGIALLGMGLITMAGIAAAWLRQPVPHANHTNS